MRKLIVVTGPELDPSAEKLVAAHGFETIHTPPYADSELAPFSTGHLGITMEA